MLLAFLEFNLVYRAWDLAISAFELYSWISTYMDSGYRTSKTSPANPDLTWSIPRQAVTAMEKGECTILLEILLACLLTMAASFVEFETAADLKKAVDTLDGRDFKEQRVLCVANVGCMKVL